MATPQGRSLGTTHPSRSEARLTQVYTMLHIMILELTYQQPSGCYIPLLYNIWRVLYSQGVILV